MRPATLDYPASHGGYIARFRADDRKLTLHRHEELECNIVLEGSAEYVLADRKYSLTPGAMVWLFPEQAHVLTDWSGNCSFWVAVFRSPLVRSQFGPDHYLSAEGHPGPSCRTVPYHRAAQLNLLVENISEVQELQDGELFNAGLAYLIRYLWNTYVSADDTVRGRSLHPAVLKAVTLLREEREAAGWPLSKAAEYCGSSVSRFAEVFKIDIGVTYLDYRSRILLERYHRLREGEVRKTISEAAFEAGFVSYRQFYRAYKKVFGVPPSGKR